jgi:hypothetical protein
MTQLTMYNLSSSYTIPRHMTELVFNYYYLNACSTNQIWGNSNNAVRDSFEDVILTEINFNKDA